MKRLIAVLGLCIASVSVSALASSVEQWSVEGWTWESSSLKNSRGPFTTCNKRAQKIAPETAYTAIFNMLWVARTH